MRRKLLYILLFAIFGLIALQVAVNKVAGSSVSFTFFDLWAPASGAFLGTTFGIVTVFIVELVNLLLHGISSIDKGAVIRLVPTLFGVWYFAASAKKGKFTFKSLETVFLLAMPSLAILSFNLNPVGRSVWFYSMFWLIPYAVWPFRKKSLIARSLGSTFTAHAVGGAVWIWAFNLPASVWVSLIPVVILERAIFALGIAASFILTTNVLSYLGSRNILPKIDIDKKYLLRFSR